MCAAGVVPFYRSYRIGPNVESAGRPQAPMSGEPENETEEQHLSHDSSPVQGHDGSPVSLDRLNPSCPASDRSRRRQRGLVRAPPMLDIETYWNAHGSLTRDRSLSSATAVPWRGTSRQSDRRSRRCPTGRWEVAGPQVSCCGSTASTAGGGPICSLPCCGAT